MTISVWIGRAAGLAVALGVGCAIASAAPASAAPEDSSGSSAQTSSAQSSSVRTSSVARAGHKSADRATPARSKAARVTTPAPKLQRPEPAIAKPIPEPISKPAPALPVQAKAVSAVGRGTPIVIFKGLHFSLPRQWLPFVKHVSGNATFTENSKYDLNNVDQYDWNKLTGITFTPLRPDTDAIMVAWRYNLTTEMFEIGPYYNKDLARIMPTPSEVISVPVGEQFDFNVDYNGITLTYGDQTVYKPLPEGLTPNVWTSVRISSWFGGTSVAPKTVSYFMRLDCSWF